MVSSPKPPNPYQTASAQQKAETGAAIGSSIINNPNEYSPYGNQVYSIAGWEQVPDANGKMQYVPRYNKTTTLSPDEQKLSNLDTGTRYNLGTTALGLSAKMGPYMQQGVNTSGWTPWQTGHEFGESTDRPAIEKALMARQEEGMGRANKAQDVQLAARGLAPGTNAYGSVEDARGRARTDAQQQAYLASGGEARSNYQTAMSYWDMLNQLRGSQAQESIALRNQPINEITALMSGAQVNLPQFSAYSRQGINAAPIGQYISDGYTNQVNAASAKNEGIFGLAGAGLGAVGQAGGMAAFFSDRRLKRGIVPLEATFAGLPLYEFSYAGQPGVRHVGVMSDEAKVLHPEAVIMHENGFEMVDYGLLARRH